MADLASLREILLHVIGVLRARVIRQVARDARRVGNVVALVLGVAIRALPWGNGMHAGQRESGL